MVKFSLTLWMFIFLASTLCAQGIRGKVTDAKERTPLAGVSILIQGTQVGSISDLEGNYSLSIPAGTYQMTVSFIGFNTQTIPVKVEGQVEVNVSLVEGSAVLDEIVVTGSRGGGRVVTESTVPVDVIGIAQLTTQTPQNNLNQILNVVAPSFTSNTTTVADGTDHIDPAQLRGLGPDQVLVLLNGKRRHTSSLVNVNGSPGRGSVGTDLNAIPAFAIEKIEVLRDGAAAQYGSDAIAGIINVKMKESTGKLNLSLYSGANFSKGSNDNSGGMDGGNLQVDANYGFRIAKKGFLNVTGSLLARQPTYRADFTTGNIFNAYNAIEYRTLQSGGDVNTLVSDVNAIKSGALGVNYLSAATQAEIAGAATLSDLQRILNIDVTEEELIARGLDRRDFNMRVGQSKLRSVQIFANGSIPLNEQHELYVFGGYSKRNGNAAGFYRRPNQSRTYTGIFINGFLPEIHSVVQDASVAAGVRGELGTFHYDLSNTFGSNSFDYSIENTVNTTMLQNSPTVFDAGGLNFKQNTINLDLNRKFDILSGFNLAFGAEGRFESYRIMAGALNSYARFDVNGVPIDEKNLNGVAPSDFFGSARPGGSQVFPGFRPVNELETQDANRQSVALYGDVELDVTNKWLLAGALRFENYSDFGNTTNFKLATRYKLTDNINVRGAFSTGFRAPSLAQIYFNATATQFVGGIPFEVGTFSNASEAAKLLGIPSLTQEKSKSLSAGFTAKIPHTNLTITADGYFVRINDRVVLTDQFSRPSGNVSGPELQLQQLFDRANATAATFFSNAINTESKGVDLVISHRAKFSNGHRLHSDLAGTISQTRQVGDVKSSDILRENKQLNRYYSETSRVYLEEAIPRIKVNMSNTLTIRKVDIFMRNAYFGKVTDPNVVDVNGDGFVGAKIVNGQAVENEHPVWGGRLITDLSIGYQFNAVVKLVVGANNLFDIYPNKNFGPSSAKRPTNIVGGAITTASGLDANGQIEYKSAPESIDLSNANQFVYSRNVSQFGMNGRFLFARLNLTF